MTTAAAPAAEAKTERKDIFVGYAGKFDASTLQADLKTKNDKPYAKAVLVVSDDKKVTVSAFTAAGIEDLKKAVASGETTIVQGFLADAPGFMNLNKIGPSDYSGELANVRSGTSENGVAYFDAILKAVIPNRDAPLPIVVKAFGDDAKAFDGLKSGDKLKAEGYATRVKENSAADADYRTGATLTKLTSFERAPKAPAAESETPSP